MRTFGAVFLFASALFTASKSWVSLTSPKRFGKLLGYALAGPDGLNEIRAQYGGFFLAVTVGSVLALLGLIPRQAGLILNAVVFGGLITGRVLSLAVDGGVEGYGAVIRALFIADATGFTLSLLRFFLTGLLHG